MEIEPKLTAWQRFKADTPKFFKKVQIIAASLAALGGTLATIHGIPVELSTVLITIGSTAAAVAQFTVKTFSDDSDNNAPQQ